MKIKGYAAFKPKEALKEYEYDANVGENDVLVRITHCGVSHGDFDFVNNVWGEGNYPLIAGHEIIGIVEEMGCNVSGFEIGERVGVGYEVKSCMECDYCKAGEENYCPEQEVLCFHHYGGFAEKIIVDSNFVFKIPDNLDSAKTAPLMSAGLTVYSALRNYNVTKEMNTAVIGIGGLGHLAVQFLDAFGCKVTAFSHSAGKMDSIKGLGADNFVLSGSENNFDQYHNSFDFILSTTTADIDWKPYIKMLKPKGMLCFVGLPMKEISFPATLLADFAQRSLCGSYIGNRKQVVEMLKFASENNIQSTVDLFPMSMVNDVLEKVGNGSINFRGVVAN